MDISNISQLDLGQIAAAFNTIENSTLRGKCKSIYERNNMSYSRWSKNSRWYVYWATASEFHKNDQILDICAVKAFTYEELKKDFEGCLGIVREIDPGASENEIQELAGHINAFIHDVETDPLFTYQEYLENLQVEKIPEIKEFIDKEIGDEDWGDRLSEGLEVLKAPILDLPLLMSQIKTDLGQMILEKRMKISM